MTPLVTVVEAPAYLSKASGIMSQEQMADVVSLIAANPLIGDVVKGTGGLRKLRVGLQGRGKRGGGRVVYWFYNEGYPAVLVWAFAKNENSDLTKAQWAALSKMTAGFVDQFGSAR
jgi:hypothetical protein